MDKRRVPVTVNLPQGAFDVPIMAGEPFTPAKPGNPADADFTLHDPTAWVPLLALAYGRSGDKGDNANIGLIARDPAFVAVLREQVTTKAVGDYFAHALKGKVERFELPGLNAFNFLLHDALGGGGIASLRYDPQGKAYAAMLLDLPVEIPAAWLNPGGPLADYPDAQGGVQ
jgi:hypothetical protein